MHSRIYRTYRPLRWMLVLTVAALLLMPLSASIQPAKAQSPSSGIPCTTSPTATFTLSLNAAQPTETILPLALDPPGIVSGPGAITVPAGSLTAPVPVTGLAPGVATLTVGPLNGTEAQSR